jgi:hypothetical protein
MPLREGIPGFRVQGLGFRVQDLGFSKELGFGQHRTCPLPNLASLPVILVLSCQDFGFRKKRLPLWTGLQEGTWTYYMLCTGGLPRFEGSGFRVWDRGLRVEGHRKKVYRRASPRRTNIKNRPGSDQSPHVGDVNVHPLCPVAGNRIRYGIINVHCDKRFVDGVACR